MSKEAVELVIANSSLQQDMQKRVTEFSNMKPCDQRVLGKQYYAQALTYAHALQIMGDSIDELEVENEMLKQELGEPDQAVIDRHLAEFRKTFSQTNKQKNERILKRLIKTMEDSKKALAHLK